VLNSFSSVFGMLILVILLDVFMRIGCGWLLSDSISLVLFLVDLMVVSVRV